MSALSTNLAGISRTEALETLRHTLHAGEVNGACGLIRVRVFGVLASDPTTASKAPQLNVAQPDADFERGRLKFAASQGTVISLQRIVKILPDLPDGPLSCASAIDISAEV
jgi:hypothetical protein